MWAIAIIATPLLNAQTTGWCNTMGNIDRKAQLNPLLQQQIENMKSYLLQKQQQNGQRADQATNETIYIPVVFHIVHNGDAIGSGENITDAQVISQITAMNLHYTAQDANLTNIPGAFAGRVGNVNVQFCLAKFDPSGNPTTGIIRHQLSNASWDTDNDIDNILKPATIWDHLSYMNIWSVNMGGQLASDGVLGYSSLPYFGGADQDGIAVRFNTVGTTGTLLSGHKLGKTITHEAGHWLGLLHIWGLDASCGDAGDYVADTPDQADLNFGCPTFPHVSCSNGPDGDMFMNYMDYTDDACSYMFSAGQATGIRNAITDYRPGILTASNACFYDLDAALTRLLFPQDSICTLDFKPVVTLKNEGSTTLTSGKFYVQVDGDAVQIINWSGSLAAQQSIDVVMPLQQLTTAGTHTLQVTFSNVNGQPADNFVGNDDKTVTFVAYNSQSAIALPFSEGFESAFPPSGWSVLNPNNDVIKWEHNQIYGGFGLSASSARLNNLAYVSNPAKRRDAIITDAFDFRNVAKPELKFDVAYARYNSTRSDSMNVYYSLDCGSNWIKAWGQKGADLATAADQTTAFAPASNEWKTVSVPLLNLSGQSRVSFKFENVSLWGNALYLDNINLQDNPALAVDELDAKVAVNIFPNPASNLVGVRLPANHKFKYLQVFNNLGQLVEQTNITDSAIVLQVQNYSNGLYLLHFKGDNVSQTEKLLISK